MADLSDSFPTPPARHAQNSGLHGARTGKKDEFYTQKDDIEKELFHYQERFRGAVVLCNCDDPKESNFWKYFERSFKILGLKKLISTHYAEGERSYKLEAVENESTGEVVTVETPLMGDGDFRSAECVEIVKEADVVVTNPPFSLFRDYMEQLISYDKKFLIIGNINALTYKAIFPLIMNEKVWFGCSIKSGDREFRVPNDYPLEAAGTRVDSDGNKYIRVKGVRWFTNLDYAKRHEDLILTKRYKGFESEYSMYDGYQILNVDRVDMIPEDYEGIMGVPITFIDKHNPDQFEILGVANSARWIGHECYTIINGVKKYNRVLIRNKKVV